MKKIERVLSIIVLLLENNMISALKLAERFNVSKRTIFRDIKTIENSGFPVISASGRNGGFSLLNSFKLKTLTYNNEEKQDILDAIGIKEELLGITFKQNTIKEKISFMQGEQNIQPSKISFNSPSVHRPEIEKNIHKKVNFIENIQKENKLLLITYVDNNGEFTERIIHPYELMFLNGSWYLYAYCEKRNNFRYFKITRIRKIEAINKPFKKISETSKEWLSSEKMLVKLRFKRENLGMLYDYYLENEIDIKKSYIDVSFYSENLHTILPLLLVFRNKVQIIAPKTLREKHKSIIESLVTTYK